MISQSTNYFKGNHSRCHNLYRKQIFMYAKRQWNITIVYIFFLFCSFFIIICNNINHWPEACSNINMFTKSAYVSYRQNRDYSSVNIDFTEGKLSIRTQKKKLSTFLKSKHINVKRIYNFKYKKTIFIAQKRDRTHI